MRYFGGVLAVGFGAVLVGCVPPPEPVSGAVLYQENCAGCHGVAARGDGPFAASLSRVPPDLTRISARNGGVFPRDYVLGVIDGFERGAHFGPDMPAFGDGDLGDTVIVEDAAGIGTPIPERLLALGEWLEGVQE